MHTRPASALRIQGLPSPWPSHHAHAALVIRLRWRCRRHSSQEPLSEEVKLEALGKIIATVAVGFDDRHAAGQKPSSAGTLRHELH